MASRSLLWLLPLLLGSCGGKTQAPPAPAAGHVTPAREAAARVRFFEIFRKAKRAAETGQQREAERLLKEALTLQPRHEAATLLLARLRAQAGDRQGALDLLDVLRKDRSALDRPAFLMGRLLSDTRPGWIPAPLLACALFEEASAKNPSSLGPYLQLARVWRLAGKPALARKAYQTVLASAAGNRLALQGLGELALLADHPHQAIPFLLGALKQGTRVAGRKDVPSEMDTQGSFASAASTSLQNIAAFIDLARAARALGSYPREVPTHFRLRHLDALGPLQPQGVLPVKAGGRPLVIPARKGGGPALLLPGKPGGTHPCLLQDRHEQLHCSVLEGLPPRGSAALADLDGDGHLDLLLGGLHREDPDPVLLIPDWTPANQHPRWKRLPFAGRLFMPTTKARGKPGVPLLSRAGTSEAAGLFLLQGGQGGALQLLPLLKMPVLDLVPVRAGWILLMSDGRLLQAARGEAGTVTTTPLLPATDARASCLTLADVTGDGVLDLILGRSAPLPLCLRALLHKKTKPFLSLKVLPGKQDGSFSPVARALAGSPPLAVRSLVPLPKRPGKPPSLLAISGSEAPDSFAPSYLLEVSGPLHVTARLLPNISPLHQNAYGAAAPPGWSNKVLLLRGGLLPGNSLPPALITLR